MVLYFLRNFKKRNTKKVITNATVTKPVINAKNQKKFNNISSVPEKLSNITDKKNKTPNKIKFFIIIRNLFLVGTILIGLLDFFRKVFTPLLTVDVLVLFFLFTLFLGILI